MTVSCPVISQHGVGQTYLEIKMTWLNQTVRRRVADQQCFDSCYRWQWGSMGKAPSPEVTQCHRCALTPLTVVPTHHQQHSAGVDCQQHYVLYVGYSVFGTQTPRVVVVGSKQHILPRLAPLHTTLPCYGQHGQPERTECLRAKMRCTLVLTTGHVAETWHMYDGHMHTRVIPAACHTGCLVQCCDVALRQGQLNDVAAAHSSHPSFLAHMCQTASPQTMCAHPM